MSIWTAGSSSLRASFNFCNIAGANMDLTLSDVSLFSVFNSWDSSSSAFLVAIVAKVVLVRHFHGNEHDEDSHIQLETAPGNMTCQY